MPAPLSALACKAVIAASWLLATFMPISPMGSTTWAMAPHRNNTIPPINPATKVRMPVPFRYAAHAAGRGCTRPSPVGNLIRRANPTRRACAEPNEEQACDERHTEIEQGLVAAVGTREQQAFEHERRIRGQSAEEADDQQ